MRLLVLISMTALLAGCAANGATNGSYANNTCPKNNHAKYAQRGTLAYDQYGCPIGADPSQQVRNSLYKDNSHSE